MDRFSRGLPAAFSLALISFPRKAFSDFLATKLLGYPYQGKMGEGFTLHCIKNLIFLFFLVTMILSPLYR